MHRFDLSSIPATPWKNGGGTTREIVCWPPGASLDRFEWRVSVATIGAAGSFSIFPGVQRQIMLLDGDGVRLRSPDGAIDHVLDQRWQPFSFPGDIALDCTPLGGLSTDFNLMRRGTRWRGGLQVMHGACVPGSTPAGLCMVLAGHWRHAGETLKPGQGLWWCAPDPSHLQLTPDAGSASALAWVGLTEFLKKNSTIHCQI